MICAYLDDARIGSSVEDDRQATKPDHKMQEISTVSSCMLPYLRYTLKYESSLRKCLVFNRLLDFLIVTSEATGNQVIPFEASTLVQYC